MKQIGLRTRLGVVAFTACVACRSVLAADHAESPGTDADPAADLADVFIFHAPDKPSNLVGVMTFGGRPAPRSRIDVAFYCDPKVLYTFNIARDGTDLTNPATKPDVQVYARFGRDANDNCGLQLENVPGAGGAFNGPLETIFTSPNGLRAFAGLRDDPFFFDAQGLTATLATFSGDPNNPTGMLKFDKTRDSFGFRNVDAIVFEMDGTTVAAGSRHLRVWATTSRLVQ